MKKLLIVLAIIIASGFYAQKINAQEEKSNVVKLSLSNLALVTPTLFYERAIAEKSSLQLGAFYTGASAGETKFTGWAVMPEYRFYPGSKGAPQGFFVAPFFKYQSYSLSSDVTDASTTYTAKASLNGLGGGLVIGGQWLLGGVVALDTYIGPSINKWGVSYEDNATEEDFDFSIFKSDGVAVGVRFGVSLGFAF